MSWTQEEIDAAIAKAVAGEPQADGVHVHLTKSVTKDDWDALDPNSYDTTCGDCDAYIVGQFGPNGEANTPCPACGSLKTKGGIGSPAGASMLAMRDASYW